MGVHCRALEDAEVLSDLLRAAEPATVAGGEGRLAVGEALAEFSARRCANGAAMVRMSDRHLRWYCEGVTSRWLGWRQSYQKVMRRLWPARFYPLLQEMVHFSNLEYAEIEAIEEAMADGWGFGAV